MKEPDLQGEYVMDFICRRDDGPLYREVKNTSVNNELFILIRLQTKKQQHGPSLNPITEIKIEEIKPKQYELMPRMQLPAAAEPEPETNFQRKRNF